MPRRARSYIAGLPCHLVQRGNNREACFIEPEGSLFYLELWRSVSSKYGVKVHAYCLMTNHIHFLVTADRADGISNTMKVVGSRYAQYVNRKYRRTGTLWEGRHRSSVVQQDGYLLKCYRYIELNPVRAGMVARPDEYRWSSYGVNAWADGGWLTPHEGYLALGTSSAIRAEAYRDLFRTALAEEDLQRFRKAAHYCQPVGDDRFRQDLEKRYGLTLGQTRRGRPKKKDRV